MKIKAKCKGENNLRVYFGLIQLFTQTPKLRDLLQLQQDGCLENSEDVY
jgi:hypothetical protein